MRAGNMFSIEVRRHKKYWVVAQWFSTGFLWSQWLIQDFANIYVYLPRNMDLTHLLFSLVIILAMLAIVFSQKGGKIQEVVKQKTNAANIRSATLIDLSYGLVLYFFTVVNPVPMSTTWVFVGILAGREFAINLLLNRQERKLLTDLHSEVGEDENRMVCMEMPINTNKGESMEVDV